MSAGREGGRQGGMGGTEGWEGGKREERRRDAGRDAGWSREREKREREPGINTRPSTINGR
eukprot:1825337-Rhodomonas_salina.1